jgi:hypothetical protein
MTITARGLIAGPPATLRTMLSKSAAFQKLVRAASEALALPSIVLSLDADELARPFALVQWGDDCQIQRLDGNGIDYWLPYGQLEIAIELPTQWNGTATAGATRTTVVCSELAGMADDFFNGFEATSEHGGTAVVSDFTGLTGTLTLTGTGFTIAPHTGEAIALNAADLSDEMTAYRNVCGDIIAEVQAQSGSTGVQGLGDWRRITDGRPPEEQETGYWVAHWGVEWRGRA